MKIIDFLEGQKSEDWLNWRRGGIGASDIPVIMGTGRFKTPLSLWNEKCGFTLPDEENRAMAHGNENESKAREWLNENLGLNLKPLCVEDEEVSYFRASFDGYDSEKKVLVEIKCPFSPKILNEAKSRQKVPEYWIDQNLWQIMFAKPTRSMIAIWDPVEERCYTIETFSLPERIREMREKASDFWRKVKMGVAPEPENQDYVVIETPELHILLSKYKSLIEEEKLIQERKKALKEEIINQGDDGNFLSFGYRITRCRPKGTYDIEKMKQDGIDVDLYLKPYQGIGYYKINLPRS